MQIALMSPPSWHHNSALMSVSRVRAGLIVAAVAALLVPLPESFLERWYSDGFYLHWQHLATRTSNLVPFALFDALVAGTIAAWMVLAFRDGRRRRWTRIAARTLAGACVFYLAFLVTWGLNYRRIPLTSKLQFDARAISADSAAALADTAIDRLNALHDAAHAMGWEPLGWINEPFIDQPLAESFARVQRELGTVDPAIPAVPKRTLLNPFFRRSGVDGMTDPYFLETLIESDALPFELPMNIAHEWGHLAGYADESEASFVGWLECVHGSVADQYSGWVFVLDELAPRDIAQRLAPGPLQDLRTMYQRRRARLSPAIQRASSSIYNGYLKANRVEAGIQSYEEVLQLILGVRFGPDWTPMIAKR